MNNQTLQMPDLESKESAAQRRNQQGKGLKILTPNQMLSRLPISLAQLKARNNFEKLKNKARQLLSSLYLQINSTKVWLTLYKMGTIFMNSKNSKPSEPHRFRQI